MAYETERALDGMSYRLRWWLVSVYVGLIALLPSQNLWLGDGYTVNSNMEKLSFYQQVWIPDGSFLISPLFILAASLMGIAAVSYLSGLVWLWAAWRFSCTNIKYGILLVCPFIFVFAGHVEIYGPVYAFSLLYLWRRRAGAGDKAIWLVLLSHSVIAAPLVATYLFDKWRSGQENKFILGLWLFGMYYISLIGFPDRPSGMDIVGAYSLLSPTHLIEVAFWGGLSLSWLRWGGAPIDKGLLIGSALGLLIFVILLPHLGMFRDLDLMMGFLIPCSVLAIGSQVKTTRWQMATAIAVTVSLLLFNSRDPQPTMYVYMKNHPAYERTYLDGRVARATAVIYLNELSDTAKAIEFARRVSP